MDQKSLFLMHQKSSFLMDQKVPSKNLIGIFVADKSQKVVI